MPPQNKPTFVRLKPRTTKPTTETTTEPTTEPTTKPTAELTTEPTTKPIAEQTPEPTTKPIAETTTNPTTEQTTKPTTSPTTDTTSTPTDSQTIFQSVGVVAGEVIFADDGKATLIINNQKYQLLYIHSKRLAFEGLKKEIAATGEHSQRLVVYPKVMHFPKKEQHYRIAFQLVAFDKGRNQKNISQVLKDNEFFFRGLWQFIPVCRTPCISVMRNFSPQRLEYIKQAELSQKVKFLKASHIPLFWKDAPLRPFRFNPKAGKEQGHPAFVQIKAKFLPQRNTFTFVEQLAPPSENAPKFLKASKDDKTSLQKTQKSR